MRLAGLGGLAAAASIALALGVAPLLTPDAGADPARIEEMMARSRALETALDRYDPETGLSAMMRTTAFPASIVALMMARNQTTSKGALPQERCIPPQLFMDELAKRKIDVMVT